MAVIAEIEYHEEDYGHSSSFHHRYEADKYLHKAALLETCLVKACSEEGIDLRVLKNPGPGSGYKEHCSRMRGVNWSMNNWYVDRDRQKIRYPRLGAFEVVVKSPPGFAPPSAKLKERIELWSKLKTRRWPNVDKLAESIMQILTSAREGTEVLQMLTGISSELNTSASALSLPAMQPRPASASRPALQKASRPREASAPRADYSLPSPGGATGRPASAKPRVERAAAVAFDFDGDSNCRKALAKQQPIIQQPVARAPPHEKDGDKNGKASAKEQRATLSAGEGDYASDFDGEDCED